MLNTELKNTKLDRVGNPKITIEVRPVFERPNEKIRQVIWTPFAGKPAITRDIFIRRTHPPIAEIPDETVYKKHWTEQVKQMGKAVIDFFSYYPKALKKGEIPIYSPY